MDEVLRYTRSLLYPAVLRIHLHPCGLIEICKTHLLISMELIHTVL